MLTNSPDQGTPRGLWPEAGLKVKETQPLWDKAAVPALTLLKVIQGDLLAKISTA